MNIQPSSRQTPINPTSLNLSATSPSSSPAPAQTVSSLSEAGQSINRQQGPLAALASMSSSNVTQLSGLNLKEEGQQKKATFDITLNSPATLKKHTSYDKIVAYRYIPSEYEHLRETEAFRSLPSSIKDSQNILCTEYFQFHEKDGKIRRFPPSPNFNATKFISDLKKEIIYDSKAEHIKKEIAGYQIDKEKKEGAFYVNGKPQSPDFTNFVYFVYSLNDGRYLVPQAEVRGCTYACEEMLLLDHGCLTIEDLKNKKEILDHRGSFRNMVDVVASIKRRITNHKKRLKYYKVKIKTFEKLHASESGKDSPIESLRKLIEKHGPCIFIFCGHAIMLDKIEINKASGERLFTTRDPFHGTCNQIIESIDFWYPNPALGQGGAFEIEAYFLLPPKHS